MTGEAVKWVAALPLSEGPRGQGLQRIYYHIAYICSIKLIDLNRFNLRIHLINIIHSMVYIDSVNEVPMSTWKVPKIIQ
jgi:hypothetical protein